MQAVIASPLSEILEGTTMVNWDETKVRLKQKISELTGDNLLFAKEKQDELLARLELKLGQTREAIIKIISNM